MPPPRPRVVPSYRTEMIGPQGRISNGAVDPSGSNDPPPAALLAAQLAVDQVGAVAQPLDLGGPAVPDHDRVAAAPMPRRLDGVGDEAGLEGVVLASTRRRASCCSARGPASRRTG